MYFDLWETIEIYLKTAEYSLNNPEDKKAHQAQRTAYNNLKERCKRYNRNIGGVIFEFKQALSGIHEA
jgi:hypothetical protein